MDEFICLTNWETGRPVFVRPSAIKAVRQLAAEAFETYGTTDLRLADSPLPHECGERTQIDTATDAILVRESANDVMQMIRKQGEGE